MDILFVIFPVIGILFSLILFCAWLDSTKKGDGLDPALGYFILILVTLSALGLTWSCLAQAYHNPTPSISFHPIEELHNIPFYINENGRPVEVVGDAKFADPKTCQFKIVVTPGGWKYCMYVTESRKVELVKRDVAVELK